MYIYTPILIIYNIDIYIHKYVYCQHMNIYAKCICGGYICGEHVCGENIFANC